MDMNKTLSQGNFGKFSLMKKKLTFLIHWLCCLASVEG